MVGPSIFEGSDNLTCLIDKLQAADVFSLCNNLFAFGKAEGVTSTPGTQCFLK